MSHDHAFHIERLKSHFDNIIGLKREIAKTKKVVVDRLAELKKVYNDLIQENSKKILLFCLDSFYFQYKAFAMELEFIDKVRCLTNNRMYCDYYKFHQLILNDIKELKFDEVVLDNERTFPLYKDLEPYTEYKIEDIRDIHSVILELINGLYKQSMSKNENIIHYNENHRVGFSISNFLNTLNYENNLLLERIQLYTNYLSFFHISQRKQIKRLHTRIQDFYTEVDTNINMNRMFSIDDIQEEPVSNPFFIIGEEIAFDTLLEDSELLLETSENVLGQLEKALTNDKDIIEDINEDKNEDINQENVFLLKDEDK
jgi:hypothetical protein